MNSDYVPRDIADGMRSIGFDEPCNRFHVPISKDGQVEIPDRTLSHIRLNDDDIPAPSYRNAFRWFRDNHELYPSIEFNERYGKWYSRWCHINGSMGVIDTHIKYEDAEDACLNKFIEFIKTKQ